MRLSCLETPRGLVQKFRFAYMRALAGRVPPPILTLSYRRDLCGKHLALCYREGLGKPQAWSRTEIEIFAAFISGLNRCLF
jgi:hypothetical protein